jgi:hypothetical protein
MHTQQRQWSCAYFVLILLAAILCIPVQALTYGGCNLVELNPFVTEDISDDAIEEFTLSHCWQMDVIDELAAAKRIQRYTLQYCMLLPHAAACSAHSTCRYTDITLNLSVVICLF